MELKKVNVFEKLDLIADHWNPRIAAELNGQQVKLAKCKGSFPWHAHENEDEMFYVLKGELTIEFRDRKVKLLDNFRIYRCRAAKARRQRERMM